MDLFYGEKTSTIDWGGIRVGYKVLVLEDNELLLETYEDFLSVHNCKASLASNVETAYELCFKQSFDIYLLDVKLPTSSGFEFLKFLSK